MNKRTDVTCGCATRENNGKQRSNKQVMPLSRRFGLLAVAALLLIGCGVLIFGFKAVPKGNLFAMLFAVLYVPVLNSVGSGGGIRRRAKVKPLALDQKLSRGMVRLLLVTSFVISFAAPWVWLLAFPMTRTQTHILAPHLFVMMSQVLFEIWGYRSCVSVVARLGIPVAFVTYRLTVLYGCALEAAMVAMRTRQTADVIMFALTGANVLFWALILFYVLLLKVCPPYFIATHLKTFPAASPPGK